jgi:NAD kinase
MKDKEQNTYIDAQESQEIEKDSYSEIKVQEEPLKIVSKKSDYVNISSLSVYMNLNFSLLIISLLLFHN